MKLRYKHQRFQENAARCVVDAFIGQPKSDGLSNFMVDPGKGDPDGIKFDMEGFGNQEIVLAQEDITENIRAVQMQQGIRPVEHLEQLQGVGTALTIEMETGTGKTYTYIKTMFELNKQYGWTKFVIVVPSIAIREGDNGTYSTDIFSESILKGKLGINAIESKKSLYDLVVVDSAGIEMSFAEKLEKEEEVEVYTKLPRGFYINTPMGRYNPDWAVVFREGSVKHIYFIAETKGEDLLESDLRTTEQNKIECARKHFQAISHGDVVYDVVKTYDNLYNKVMK